MALSDKEKAEKLRRIIIKRLENIGSPVVLITQFKNLSWTKIKILINQALQQSADQCDINIQNETDKKADILALKNEIETY